MAPRVELGWGIHILHGAAALLISISTRCSAILPHRHFWRRYCTKGTFFYSLKAPVSLILEVLKLLSEGMGLRAVCRSKSVTPDAVSAWVQKAAKHVREVTVYLERDMHLTQCQIDEFWSYILKKSEPE